MVSHAECGVTCKPIKSNSSAGCGVRYKFENFENILFANVNFEVFDAELRLTVMMMMLTSDEIKVQMKIPEGGRVVATTLEKKPPWRINSFAN